MESRRFFTGVVALGLSASLLSPVADAAVIGPQDPATKLCAFYLSPAEYARLMNAARLHFSAPEKEYALDYQTFRQAFPELGKVEEDVYKRIREEEGREFLAPSSFARPDSLQHTYAVEAFTEAGLPASVAEWYLFKYSPQRTTPQASADDVLTYHYYELMGQYQVLGPGQRALFRPVTQATETPDIARELQTRFPGLSDAAATAWAQQYADTFFYTNLRRVKEYVTLRERAEQLCAAGGDATLALPIPPNAVNTVVPPIPTLTTSHPSTRAARNGHNEASPNHTHARAHNHDPDRDRGREGAHAARDRRDRAGCAGRGASGRHPYHAGSQPGGVRLTRAV